MKHLICDRCREVIARFDPETIHRPLTTEMFLPKADGRGLAAPFKAQEFNEFKCPYGPHFPFKRESAPDGSWIWDGTLQTPEGRFLVPEKKVEVEPESTLPDDPNPSVSPGQHHRNEKDHPHQNSHRRPRR